MRVPLNDPVREFRELRDAVTAAVSAVLDSGRYVLGERLEAFETAFAEEVGAAHAVGVASGTDAVELALEALGVGPGDEVVTSPFTFVATVGAILATGATPVFADVLPDTFILDPDAAAAAVTPRTAAIVPVHVFGQMADLDALGAVAGRHGLALVEDAAQAFGASQRSGGDERRAGATGVAGTFSFYPTKSLAAAGDGGMVVTSDRRVADRLRRLRNHGRGDAAGAAELGAGHNSRLDPIQAALLHAKLPHVEGWTERRIANAAAYDRALAESPGICPPATAPGNRHIFHQYTILCHGRDHVGGALAAAGIDVGRFYDPPLHLHPALARLGVAEGSLPVAEELATRVLSVPVFAHLTDEERVRVADALAASGSLQPG